MKVCAFGEIRLLQDSAFFVGCYECYIEMSMRFGGVGARKVNPCAE